MTDFLINHSFINISLISELVFKGNIRGKQGGSLKTVTE